MLPDDQHGTATDTIASVPPADIELQPVTTGIVLMSKRDGDQFLVTFHEPFDAENPLNWPKSRKWTVTDVLSATGFNRIMVSTIMAPALSTITNELHMNSAESVMALSIYLLATAFGPLVIGPLSEVYGRKVILHASNVWFLIWNIVCGFANTKELLIGARFLAGFGASSIYALAGGVLGDVWRPEERGRSLGTYLLIPLLGAAVGPIIGGFMAARTTWRWMFWSTSIFQVVMILVSFTAFDETYGPVILKSRAERLRRETGDSRYHALNENLDNKSSIFKLLGRALVRPLRLLAFHPIIQVSSLISAFYYGILYIVLSTFSDLWIKQYHESIEISSLHYIACALGEVSGSQLGGPLLDFLYQRMKARGRDSNRRHSTTTTDDNTAPSPESRIPLAFPAAFLAPLGLFLYGWTAQYKVHWIAVDIGIVLTTFGMQILGMVLQAYVIDAYADNMGPHTSSAMAASQFLRSLTAFLFPLFAPRMYATMGYGWGNSCLGFAGLLLGLPAPLILWVYGTKLRAKASLSY